MFSQQIRHTIRSAWTAYRNPPGKISRNLIEQTPRGPRIRGTQIMVEDVVKLSFASQSADILARICKTPGNSCTVAPDGILVSIDGVEILAQCYEDLWIVQEVFLERCYNISLDSPFVVIDIGMNIGTTSLWFSRQPNMVAVYSFEPVPKTYSCAVENLKRNPEFSSKISHHCFGLGGNDRDDTIQYNESQKGIASIIGWRDQQLNPHSRVEDVKIVNASDKLREIAGLHPGTDIVAKIDCEGAEYEIVSCLEQQGALSLLSALAIEWHSLGPSNLISSLHRSGFKTLCHGEHSQSSGMIYAFR